MYRWRIASAAVALCLSAGVQGEGLRVNLTGSGPGENPSQFGASWGLDWFHQVQEKYNPELQGYLAHKKTPTPLGPP